MSFLVLGIVTVGATGCSWILPSHSNSYDLEGEQVEVRFLTLDALKQSIGAEGLNLKGYELPKPAVLGNPVSIDAAEGPEGKSIAAAAAALLATVAGAAIEYAIDFVQGQLKDAADAYEAQWSGKQVADGFWKPTGKKSTVIFTQDTYYTGQPDGDNPPKNVRALKSPFTAHNESYLFKKEKEKYTRLSLEEFKNLEQVPIPTEYVQAFVAFEIIRTTKQSPEGAVRLIVDLKPSADGQLLIARPVYMRANTAKAKVLNKEAWPWAWATLFMKADDSIDVEMKLTFESTWINKDGKVQKEKTAETVLPLGTYDIDVPKHFYFQGNMSKEAGWQKGKTGGLVSLPLPPVSTKTTTDKVGSGLLEVSALFTERDTSQCRKQIQQLATKAGDQKDKVVKIVVEAIQGKKDE